MATVSYTPNDPLATGSPPLRQVKAGRLPSGNLATFKVEPSAVAGTYQPLTPEFDYWQTVTALAAVLRAWKGIEGSSLKRWFGNRKTLPVLTNSGDDLNAFYDRSSLQFFSHTFGGVTVHSAESTDVVTHEAGHGLLDAIRSDFFDVPFIEVGALHEAFGDSMAILTAISDKDSRDAILAASPDLSKNHFVESLAEQLGDAIRREFGPASVEAGALRHALNKFSWSDPTSLPASASADKLSGEVHSFSRVFSGAFYDVIRNIYLAGPRTAIGLRNAGQTAGKLLVAGLKAVPAAPRIYAGVGQRMLQADITMNGGANASAIQAAFAAHGMTLAAPAASLPVPLGKRTRSGASRELRERLGVPAGTSLTFTPVESPLHGSISHVTAYRPVTLTGTGLDGVRVMVPASARVARRGGSITGTLGEVTQIDGDADEQARAFARSLVASGQVRTAPRATRRLAAPPQPPPNVPQRAVSHEIRIVDDQPTLVRVGFACR
jgi:hypothetical protein